MNFLIFIHDLTIHNAHLMPWRTVCEVVNHAQQKGHEAKLVSLCSEVREISGPGIPSGTIEISKAAGILKENLHEAVRQNKCDVILWPVVWREPYWRIRAVTSLGVPVIGYFPGGVYRLRDTLYASKIIGMRKALPYLVDAIWPKRFQLKKWNSSGIQYLIAMTRYTEDVAIANGWKQDRITAIPPGRDVDECDSAMTPLPATFRDWLNCRPFFMFAGPPSAIRGIYQLLEAFDRLAAINVKVCLVCLFRSDAPLEAEKIIRVISKMKHQERVYAEWESLSKEQLESFMSECHGVVLPFVTVPSEIPLAIIEAMRYGKPVITTMTGGTGDFVSKSGEAVPLGDVDALATSMSRLLTDVIFYQDKCNATSEAYRRHPAWDVMADLWVKCMLNVYTSNCSI